MTFVLKTLIRIIPQAYMKKILRIKTGNQFKACCGRKIDKNLDKKIRFKKVIFMDQRNTPHKYQSAGAVKYEIRPFQKAWVDKAPVVQRTGNIPPEPSQEWKRGKKKRVYSDCPKSYQYAPPVGFNELVKSQCFSVFYILSPLNFCLYP